LGAARWPRPAEALPRLEGREDDGKLLVWGTASAEWLGGLQVWRSIVLRVTNTCQCFAANAVFGSIRLFKHLGRRKVVETCVRARGPGS
jgi:hypothetical protein